MLFKGKRFWLFQSLCHSWRRFLSISWHLAVICWGWGGNAPCLSAASYVQALSLLPTLSFKRRQAWGFPHNSDGKESTRQCGRLEPTCQCRRLGFDPWVRKREEGVANPFSIVAWRISRTEEPGRFQSIGSQQVGHGWFRAHTGTFVQVSSL